MTVLDHRYYDRERKSDDSINHTRYLLKSEKVSDGCSVEDGGSTKIKETGSQERKPRTAEDV